MQEEIEQKKESPSFYAIIPAVVRYDKELTPNAKLLYGEITALCDKKGYCWASNPYFVKLYGVSDNSITRWVGQLRDRGYISVNIYNERENNRKRVISLGENSPIKNGVNSPIKNDSPIKNERGPYQKSKGGPIKNGGYSNTYNNTEILHSLTGTEVQEIEKPLVKEDRPIKKSRIILGYTQKEINATILLLQDLNIDWQNWYKPTSPQRNSVAKVMKFAKESNMEIPTLVKKALELRGVQYEPQIWTPCDMAEKFSKLITTKKKESNLKPGNIAKDGRYDKSFEEFEKKKEKARVAYELKTKNK